MKILVPDDRTLGPVASRVVASGGSAKGSTTTSGRTSLPTARSPFEREEVLLAQPAKKP